MMTSIPRAFATATSATLVVPQSTVTMTVAPAATAASIAATDRPWPSSSRLGTYGSTATPKRRSAMVMMASPVRPSASKSPKTRTRSPRSRAARRRARSRSASGSWFGSWSPSSGSANQAAMSSAVDGTAAGEEAGHAPREAEAGRCRDGARRGRDGAREGPAVARFDHVVRMPWRRCTTDLPTLCVAHLRTPCAALAGCATRSGDHVDGRPTGASPRAAGSPRRSTNRSRR